MTLLDRALQDLDLGVAAADSILELDIQAELVGLEIVKLSGFFRDGFQKLVDEIDRRSLGESSEGRLGN